ncbi:MAG: hypothetical protein HUU15_02395 [Candidatus Brocadiae bacterium]|nr:hypothetical protein [Candidatus Brocadiia bacterium]
MKGFPPDLQKRIIEALNNKGANKACPRCGHGMFGLVNKYHVASLQDSHEGLVFQGDGLPTVIVNCQNCGWLAHHALYLLLPDLRPPEKPEGGALPGGGS